MNIYLGIRVHYQSSTATLDKSMECIPFVSNMIS